MSKYKISAASPLFPSKGKRPTHRFSMKKQIIFLDKVLRLARVGIAQDKIVEHTLAHGAAIEKIVAQDIKLSLTKGQGFALGLKPWISPIAYQSLASGEASGDFRRGLRDAIQAVQSRKASTVELAITLAKPMVGLIIVLTVSSLFVRHAYPIAGANLPYAQWGTLSVLAQSLGHFIWSHGITLLGLLGLLIVALTYALPHWSSPHRAYLDNWLVFRQFRLIHTAHFLSSIAHQIHTHTPIRQALLAYQDTTNPYMASHIQAIQQRLKTGKNNTGYLFDVGLLTPSERDTLYMLGNSGEIGDTLLKSAEMHHEMLTFEMSLIKSVSEKFLKLLLWGAAALCGGGLITLAFDSTLSTF